MRPIPHSPLTVAPFHRWENSAEHAIASRPEKSSGLPAPQSPLRRDDRAQAARVRAGEAEETGLSFGCLFLPHLENCLPLDIVDDRLGAGGQSWGPEDSKVLALSVAQVCTQETSTTDPVKQTFSQVSDGRLGLRTPPTTIHHHVPPQSTPRMLVSSHPSLNDQSLDIPWNQAPAFSTWTTSKNLLPGWQPPLLRPEM